MMLHLDWRNCEDYRFAAQLNAGQWAWEFLRRNPAYQADWRWFHSAWQRLEARYGKPPERDFQAWQRDPDAYRVVDDEVGDCRIDKDKVLIECWMGSKWGFYKFPLDPVTDQPDIGEQLSWRALPEEVCVVDKTDPDSTDGERHRLALAFEMDMPLRPQLEAAQQFLQRRQAFLRKQGGMQMRTVAALSTDWTLMLRLLDGRDAGETVQSMRLVLGEFAAETMLYPRAPSLAPQFTLPSLLEQADALVRGGYRYLAFLPGARS